MKITVAKSIFSALSLVESHVFIVKYAPEDSMANFVKCKLNDHIACMHTSYTSWAQNIHEKWDSVEFDTVHQSLKHRKHLKEKNQQEEGNKSCIATAFRK